MIDESFVGKPQTDVRARPAVATGPVFRPLHTAAYNM
jgi:hypothetical protein